MGSNGASGSGSADAPNTTRSTLSTKNQQKVSDKNEKNKTKFGYDKPKSTLEKVGDFVKTGGITGAVVRGVTSVVKGVTSSVRRGRVNTSLMGTSDYQGSTTRSSATNSMNDGRGDNNNGNQVVQAPTVKAPTSIEVSQVASVPKVTEEEARATANELIKKKRRGRGRSMLVATSSKGATDENLTLSQKSLLG
tara:strand:- start:27 stop:605 length:579 start_codon:yes stop_codon:yes gene_type:complete